MENMIEKEVTVFSKEVRLRIPSEKALLSSMEEFSQKFDIGANLVLHVFIKPQKNLPSNHIITEVFTKDGVPVSHYEAALIHDDKLFDRLNSEIENTLGNVERDANAIHDKSAKLTDTLADILKTINMEIDHNTPSGGHAI